MKYFTSAEFLLLHFADSAFPTGGFAYSAGLEGMVEFGLIEDERDLTEYVFEYSKQTLSFESPFISGFFDTSESPEDLKEAALCFEATFVASAMLEGSLNLGKNWIRLMENILQGQNQTARMVDYLKDHKIPLHFLLLIVLFLKQLGFEKEKIVLFYLSSVIRDQISAAIRLGIIGPIQGHAIQHFIYTEIAASQVLITSVPYQEAVKTGFLTDVGQMLQKNVYSKLFKN